MTPSPPVRKLLAWSVHGYTALGLVAAAWIVVLLSASDLTPEHFRQAFLLMFVATIIDATDGTFARLVRVKEVLPGFDGRRLDDLIDFLNYACLPLWLVWRAGLVPPGLDAWLVVPLLASAYGFSQSDAKTPDGYFLGFPSYWNLVAFYLYVLQAPGPVSLGLILFLALLTFVPTRYLYPTQAGGLNRLTCFLGAAWAMLLVTVLLPPGHATPWFELPHVRFLTVISLAFPVYYLVVSWWISLRAIRLRRSV